MSKYGKIQTKKNSIFGHFLRSTNLLDKSMKLELARIVNTLMNGGFLKAEVENLLYSR